MTGRAFEWETAADGPAGLAETGALLDAIFADPSVGRAVFDRDLRFVRVNDRLAAINGLPASAHLGRTLREALGDRPAGIVEPLLRQVIETGQPLLDVEIEGQPARLPDGPHTYLASYHPVRSGETVLGVAAVVRDVTAERAAKAALAQSAERYRSLTAVMSSVVWSTDAAGAFVEPQPGWAAYTGQPWSTHQGWGWAEMVHPEDRERVRRLWAEALATETVYHSECRLWHAPTRQYRYIRARAVPLRDPGGAVREWVGTVTDIHERRSAVIALRESEARYRRLIEQASDAITVSELNGPFVEVNSRACELLGYTREELLQLRVIDLIPEEDLAAKPLRVDELLAGKVLRLERRLRRKDGTLLPVETSSVLLDDGRVQIITRDIGERQRAEAQREELLRREQAVAAENARLYQEAQAAVRARCKC